MFHRATDASKVALVALVRRLVESGPEGLLLDVQWATPHLVSLGPQNTSDLILRRFTARAPS
jgi:leucyl/phenylalanyl-tRNA--protein transferase